MEFHGGKQTKYGPPRSESTLDALSPKSGMGDSLIFEGRVRTMVLISATVFMRWRHFGVGGAKTLFQFFPLRAPQC
jgi:hypothetical protein